MKLVPMYEDSRLRPGQSRIILKIYIIVTAPLQLLRDKYRLTLVSWYRSTSPQARNKQYVSSESELGFLHLSSFN